MFKVKIACLRNGSGAASADAKHENAAGKRVAAVYVPSRLGCHRGDCLLMLMDRLRCGQAPTIFRCGVCGAEFKASAYALQHGAISDDA